MLYYTTRFAIKQLVVYSDFKINANKKLKQLHVCQIQQWKKINQRDTEWIGSVMLQFASNQMAFSDRLFWDNCLLLVLPQANK